MEQRNITSSQHPRFPETTAVPMDLGACFVIDDNPENKDDGFNITSDEKPEDIQHMDIPSDNDTKKFTKSNVTSVNKPEDNLKRIPKTLQSNIKDNPKERLKLVPKSKLKNNTDGRCSVKPDKTATDCLMVDMSNQALKFDAHNVDKRATDCLMVDMSNQTLKFDAHNVDKRATDCLMVDMSNQNLKCDAHNVDRKFYDRSIKNQSGYDADEDTNKDGESSGNQTDSDSETKKILADKAKLVIEKAIARLDAIKEELVEVVVFEDKESTSDKSGEPGSSCTDTTVSEYNTTDLEEDTDIPKEILHKLLGKENKPYHMVRKSAKNTKRKQFPE